MLVCVFPCTPPPCPRLTNPLHPTHPPITAVWLKGKADDFYRRGDYGAAANAYTAALDGDPEMLACLANRAACYLLMGRVDVCIKDCDEVLRTLGNGGDNSGDTSSLRARVLVRRGTALCRDGRYSDALRDYKEAAALRPTDAKLAGDVHRVQRLVQCTYRHKLLV